MVGGEGRGGILTSLSSLERREGIWGVDEVNDKDEDEMVAADLDMHSLILSSNPAENAVSCSCVCV